MVQIQRVSVECSATNEIYPPKNSNTIAEERSERWRESEVREDHCKTTSSGYDRTEVLTHDLMGTA